MILTAPQLWTPRWWRLPRRLGELAAMAGGHLCTGSGGHLKLGTGNHLTTGCTSTAACSNCLAGTLPQSVPVTLAGITLASCCGRTACSGTVPNGTYDLPNTAGCGYGLTIPWTAIHVVAYDADNCTGSVIGSFDTLTAVIQFVYQPTRMFLAVDVRAGINGSVGLFTSQLNIDAPYNCSAHRTFPNDVDVPCRFAGYNGYGGTGVIF
jgi:hypothetical protein